MRTPAALAFVVSVFASAALADDDGKIVLGAVGDSITAGFNAQHLGDNRALSWSTGDNPLVRSHKQRLEALLGLAVEAQNESIAGSVAQDLERQVTRLLEAAPDYVTMAIGANDVCDWADDHHDQLARFEYDVRMALRRIVEARPEAHVTLGPIPDLHNLWEVASPQPNCQLKWNIIGVCSPLLDGSRTPEQREAFKARWWDANLALERIAADFPENVRFDLSAAQTQFSWSHVSTIDCFHPSIAGQNFLAEKTWQFAH